MTDEQIEQLIQLAKADDDFWQLLKRKELELEEYFTTHSEDVAVTLPQPTIPQLVRSLAEKHFGRDLSLNYSFAIVPIRKAIRNDLGK